jgi:hypothetical protein
MPVSVQSGAYVLVAYIRRVKKEMDIRRVKKEMVPSQGELTRLIWLGRSLDSTPESTF